MSLPTHLTIATRESPLALWQAEHAKQLLLTHWPQLTIELLPLKTSGDKFLNAKLLDIGGKGLFVKELEEALLDKRADLAVHSMKDVPATLPDDLQLSTIFSRHNPLDAFVSEHYASLDNLPEGAIVGTSSLRREAQLLIKRPDIDILPIRGNVGTRLNKLKTENYDAIILAAAGLERLGLEKEIKEILAEEVILPAAGQGALGIECRVDDNALQTLLEPLHHKPTAICVEAERMVNHHLGGNCHTPIALFCRLHSTDEFKLDALIASPNGKSVIRDSQVGAIPEELAKRCITSLQTKGAHELLNEIQSDEP